MARERTHARGLSVIALALAAVAPKNVLGLAAPGVFLAAATAAAGTAVLPEQVGAASSTSAAETPSICVDEVQACIRDDVCSICLMPSSDVSQDECPERHPVLEDQATATDCEVVGAVSCCVYTDTFAGDCLTDPFILAYWECILEDKGCTLEDMPCFEEASLSGGETSTSGAGGGRTAALPPGKLCSIRVQVLIVGLVMVYRTLVV